MTLQEILNRATNLRTALQYVEGDTDRLLLTQTDLLIEELEQFGRELREDLAGMKTTLQELEQIEKELAEWPKTL